MLLLIPLLPLLGFLLNASFGRRVSKGAAGAIACGAMIASFAIAVVSVWRLLRLLPEEGAIVNHVFTWIASGDFTVAFTLHLDPLSAVMILVVTGIGSLIHVYSTAYMHEETDPEYARYFSYLNLFAFFMLVLVLGANFLVMFVGWEGVGLCSYLLIGFWYQKKSAADAGKKAFIVNRIGDFGFILGVLLAFVRFGSIDFQDLARSAAAMGAETSFGTVSLITLLLFVGATGKSAQIPLYIWLPDAMEGPTPVSALIHAATMVTAGVYMIGRNAVLFSRAPETLAIVAVIGAATALMAGTIGLVQNDIKRVLAYSTVSQLGYMFLAMGVGAFGAGIFHLYTHAFFKALLFLGSGAVIHALAGEQDLRRMGGLKRHLPITYWTFLIGALAIAGVPGLAGFFSKDEILFRTYASGHTALWTVGLVTSLLTAIYMFRVVFLAFHGPSPSATASQVDSPSATASQVDSPSATASQVDSPSATASQVDSPSATASQAGAPSTRLRGDAASAWQAEHAAPEHATTEHPAREHPAPEHSALSTQHPALGVHDAPPAMAFALIVLALGSIVAGYVGLGARFEHFLEPSFAPQAVEASADAGLELTLMVVSSLVALIGIGIAVFFFLRNRSAAAGVAERFRGLYRVLLNKYYVDEIYDAAIVQPIRIVSEDGLWKVIDARIIDGTVNAVAAAVGGMSAELRRMQTGSVRTYAASLFFGVVAILGYYLWG